MSQMDGQKPDTGGGNKKKALFGGLGIAALAALKFKAFGLIALKLLSGFKFLAFLKPLLSMFFMIAVYTMLFGPLFAAIVIVLIFIHEMGHYVFMKAFKLDPQAPFFLPFLAFVRMNREPQDQATHAWVSLGGPLIGGVTAVMFYYFGVIWHWPLLMAAGNIGVLLNVMQLIPAKPLDGGYILHAISKWFLVIGTGLTFVVGVFLKSPLFLLVAVISLFTTYSALKTVPAPDGTINGKIAATQVEKYLIGASYFTLLGVLGFVYWFSHNELIRIVPPQ